MPGYRTPGVYFERAHPRSAPVPQRTDIAGFVGLAERGPLHTPVRVTNWREFQATFGGFVSYAHLAYAIRGFFDNGADAAWIVRVADEATARPASAALLDGDGRVAYEVIAANPGRWGEGLTVSVQAALGRGAPVAGALFTLLVWEKGEVAERFANLAPAHAVETVNRGSQFVRLTPGPGDPLPTLPQRVPLAEGVNGLRDLTIYHWIGTPNGQPYGLAALAEIDEVALLVMPDLTARPPQQSRTRRAPHRKIAPCALDVPPQRDVVGRVTNAETGAPVAGATVEANDGLRLQRVETDANGQFVLTDVLTGTVELVVEYAGFEEAVASVLVVAGAAPQSLEAPLRLHPLDLPPALSHTDVELGQAAMIAQCEQLRDRFALLDPPLTESGDLLDINGILAWRARFDTAFAALYFPWLRVSDPLNLDAPRGRLVPPTGHVAGMVAATDLSEGVFRAPANRPLAWVNDVGTVIDDALQEGLNPVGINAIRVFPGRGVRVYGARTLSSDTAWRFINVRRLVSMIEESLYDDLQWAVFEPNSVHLQLSLRLAITAFLDQLWRQGALVGGTADAAYVVRCDETTTPPEEAAEGRVIAEVRLAPAVPYEFIVLRLGTTVDELLISEV